MKKLELILLIALTLAAGFGYSQTTTEYFDPRGKPLYPDFDPKTGGVKNIRGFSEHIKNYGLTKNQLTKESLDKFARRLIDDYSKILKITSKDLRANTIDTSGDLQGASYEQLYKGIRIVGSEFGITVGIRGDISFGGKIFPLVQCPTTPSIPSETAVKIAESDSGGSGHGKPMLAIIPVENDSTYEYRLAWTVYIGLHGYKNYRYHIDASDGKVLRRVKSWVEARPSQGDQGNLNQRNNQKRQSKKRSLSLSPLQSSTLSYPTSSPGVLSIPVGSGISGRVTGRYWTRYHRSADLSPIIGFYSTYIDAYPDPEDENLDFMIPWIETDT
ncbi:MAG: hypothetical protein QME58_10340 [Bacteroidota bacterium]|nr:hypothetical protein [Bacteroidota bacterium]